MSKTLHDYEMNYSPVEKQALSLVKEIAHFRTYILSNHVIDYVPHTPINMLLNQQLNEGRWVDWLAKIQEYEKEIKSLKVVRGKGLCKYMIGTEVVNTSYVDGFNIIIK